MLERAVIATMAGTPTTIFRISRRRSSQAEFSEKSPGSEGIRLEEISLEDIAAALSKDSPGASAQNIWEPLAGLGSN